MDREVAAQREPDISFARQKPGWERKVPLNEGLRRIIPALTNYSRGRNEPRFPPGGGQLSSHPVFRAALRLFINHLVRT